MIKKMLYRKIIVASSLLIIIFLLYLVPGVKNEVELVQEVEYVNPGDEMVIYLLDENDYVVRTKMLVNKANYEDMITDLLLGLTVDGSKKDIIPNGFKPLLPKGTKVLDVSLNEGILKINFSSEFNKVDRGYEEKLIEAITYTLTSISGIDKIEIYVEGDKLEKLPNGKRELPEYLDRNYGINKKYEFTSLDSVTSYTVYYVSKNKDDSYYIPVTKYINNTEQDKVKVIIDELATSVIYESNLASFLDMNVKLLDYEIKDNQIRLNFNDKILSNITENVILEEVMYTIGLSLLDELDVTEVIFYVNDSEKAVLKLD